MREIRLKLGLFFLLAVLIHSGFAQEETISIQFGPSLEIGREDFFFGIIAGVCEDENQNFYVLDKTEHRVNKFSQKGTLILKFGNKGEGPGDFRRPDRITYTADKQIVVCDEMYFVSFFKPDGSFIKRVELNSRLAPGYIGENRFYGWIWLPEGQQQVMVDGKNEIVRTFHTRARDSFSVSAPDKSGRQVMFNYGKDEFAQSFIFSRFRNYTALGISSEYDIKIMDSRGEIYSHIQREIKPERFSQKEKKYFSEDLKALSKKRGWPDKVVRDLEKIIPNEKTYFDHVLLSEEHVFVFRIRHDITQEEGFAPVDVFTLNGDYLGSTEIEGSPVHISEKNIYFVQSDVDGNVYLVKKSYTIKTK